MSGRAALRTALAGIPGRLARAARAAPTDGPAPGEWTPSDIVRHLIAVELEVWHPRLAALAAEDHPTWAWVEPDRWTGEPGASLAQLLAVHEAARGATLRALDELGDAGWARTGTHATFGLLDVAGLMTKALDHDEEHLRSFDPARFGADLSGNS
jgi:hypothetical protein